MTLICSFCSKSDFKTEKGLRSHVTRMHPDSIGSLEKKEWPCTKCSRSFTLQTGLSRHMNDHKIAELLEQKKREERFLELENELSKRNEEVAMRCEIQSLSKQLKEATQMIKFVSGVFWFNHMQFQKGNYFIPIDSVCHRDVISLDTLFDIMAYDHDAIVKLAEYLYFNDAFPQRQSFHFFKEDNEVFVEKYDTQCIVDANSFSEELILICKKVFISFFENELKDHNPNIDYYHQTERWWIEQRVRENMKELKFKRYMDMQKPKLVQACLLYSESRRACIATSYNEIVQTSKSMTVHLLK